MDQEYNLRKEVLNEMIKKIENDIINIDKKLNYLEKQKIKKEILNEIAFFNGDKTKNTDYKNYLNNEYRSEKQVLIEDKKISINMLNDLKEYEKQTFKPDRSIPEIVRLIKK